MADSPKPQAPTPAGEPDAAAQMDAAAERRAAAAARALQEAAERRAAAEAGDGEADAPKEIGGRDGPDPTRYGDWENKGVISDF